MVPFFEMKFAHCKAAVICPDRRRVGGPPGAEQLIDLFFFFTGAFLLLLLITKIRWCGYRREFLPLFSWLSLSHGRHGLIDQLYTRGGHPSARPQPERWTAVDLEVDQRQSTTSPACTVIHFHYVQDFFLLVCLFAAYRLTKRKSTSEPFDPFGQSFVRNDFLFIYRSRSLHRLLLSGKGESSWFEHATFELIHQESTAADMKLKVCSMQPATWNTVDFYRFFFPVRR